MVGIAENLGQYSGYLVIFLIAYLINKRLKKQHDEIIAWQKKNYDEILRFEKRENKKRT
jgi:hypothetical protein